MDSASMPRRFLTVLTTPIASTPSRLYRRARGLVGQLVKPHARPRKPSPYPGHYSLVRSVVEGLRQIDADFNFNPVSFSDLGDVVYAPANEALRQAIGLKRTGRIKTLLAGPTNALLPHQSDGILLAPEIDVVIAPSNWVRELYASRAPALARKTHVCQAGVDVDFWKPAGRSSSTRAVVYWKDAPEDFCVDVERLLQTLGLETMRVRYGSYDRESFRSVLSEASLAVFLSTFETQGLALAEAWAMDVPTIVWNPQAPTVWLGEPFVAGSSCPYLTPATGVAWKTLDELELATRTLRDAPHLYSPRAWVCSHMTDAIGAAALYAIARDAARGLDGAQHSGVR